jgi:hypothetical protein
MIVNNLNIISDEHMLIARCNLKMEFEMKDTD